MNKRVSKHIKKLLPCIASGSDSPIRQSDVDVREEYANAFRTESYNQFWTNVLALSHKDSPTCLPLDSTTAARLPSYRLFAEHLLDPDQPTVTRILALARIRPTTVSLLSEYFSQTANASQVCGLLLNDIDHTRVRYRSFQTTVQYCETTQVSHDNQCLDIITRLTEFSRSNNPFVPSASSLCCVRVIQTGCTNLLKRLESSRDKARAKLRLMNGLEHASGILVVALAASLTAIVASHALALLVAAPTIVAASLELASMKRLTRTSAQLDAAAKGTYILNRDLDTISRLVARLNDEVEHMRTMAKFYLVKGDDRLQASSEVVRQLKRNDASFSQQLDELEEHLYLCFMTINRARSLVVKEITDPGRIQPVSVLDVKSM